MKVKLYYLCECCQKLMGTLEMEELDEEKLGFSCLTPEEREDIITVKQEENSIYIKSICEECASVTGFLEKDRFYYPLLQYH